MHMHMCVGVCAALLCTIELLKRRQAGKLADSHLRIGSKCTILPWKYIHIYIYMQENYFPLTHTHTHPQ